MHTQIKGSLLCQVYLSLSLKNDCMRKKGKGHLVGFYMTQYTASHTPFKIVAEQSQTTTLTCKVCLVLNHPEIALIFFLNSR